MANRKGRVTIPTDLDVVPQTKEIMERWGADALRDCDGTEFPQELKDTGAKIYATYCTTRKDNAWAKANPDEVQQMYIMTPFHTAVKDTLEIHLMDHLYPAMLKVNTYDDIQRWWEVMDRTTGAPVPVEDWRYDGESGNVVIRTVPFHQYTVSFLTYIMWDPVNMYNAVVNDWKDAEPQITFDVRQPKTHAHSMERLRQFLDEHPYVDVIRRSFCGAVNGEFVGIENYRTIFANKAFRLAAGNTLRFFGVCVPLLVVLSLIIAVLLAGQKRFTQILKSFFLLPMAIPVASVVLLWRLLFDDQGLLNHLLHMLSVQTTDWMNTGASFYVLVISYIWRNLGYDVVLWMAGLSAIPAALYEAAKVDGAGEWKCFTKITLPNLLPSLFTIVVLSVLNAFKVFREAYLVAGDYPQEKMYLLQHLFNNWYRDLSLDKMSAAAVVTGLVIFLLILGLWKAWGKGGAE